MKLDSIIYDINTLQTALTEKTVSESATFNAMYPSDTATSLMTVLAGYGSMLQYGLVSAMANCYTDTVYSEAGIYQLAETLGNRLRGNVSSQISVYITRKSLLGVVGVTIPAHSVWDADGIKFYNPHNETFLNDNKKLITLVQGEYKTYKTTTGGTVEERIYFSQDFKCNLETVKVFVNGEEWSTSETFLPLNANNLIDNTEMQCVLLRVDPDGRTYIKFGNNTTGLLPKSGSIVEIQYVENEGSEGNIASDSINITLVTPIYHFYEGNSVLLDVECENTTVAAGGYNTQSLEVLKETSPYIFASGGRAISREDYKAMLINKCGYMTCNVWGEYEESVYNGYYDKSMMNTVYYTGIKQLQHYDYKPLGTVTNLNISGTDLLENPYNFTGNIGTIKGFPGSYSIDFIYSSDQNIRMRYRDRYGTGILTCDPSENDGNGNLYPFNDIGNSLVNNETARVTIVGNEIEFQDYEGFTGDLKKRIEDNVPASVRDYYDNCWTSDITTVFKYNTEDDQPQEDGHKANYTFIWDGFNQDNRSKNLSFSNPIRICFSFNPNCPTPISAIAFRNPSNISHVGHCPGKFALFGTNELETVAPNDYVRNNVNWKKIIDVQQIEFNPNGRENNWSDWFTTNLYQPNKTITDAELNSEVTVLYDEWQAYSRYVLEIYSYQDETLAPFGQYMLIPGIKMLYANNNEDYYAWVYAPPKDPETDETIDYKKDWEPSLVYLVSASANLTTLNKNSKILNSYGAEYIRNVERDYNNAYAWIKGAINVYTASATPNAGDMAYKDSNLEAGAGVAFEITNYIEDGAIEQIHLQPLVKTDGNEYPSQYFYGYNDDESFDDEHRYYYSPTNYITEEEKIKVWLNRDIYIKSKIIDDLGAIYERDKSKDDNDVFAWTFNDTITVFTLNEKPAIGDIAYSDSTLEESHDYVRNPSGDIREEITYTRNAAADVQESGVTVAFAWSNGATNVYTDTATPDNRDYAYTDTSLTSSPAEIASFNTDTNSINVRSGQILGYAWANDGLINVYTESETPNVGDPAYKDATFSELAAFEITGFDLSENRIEVKDGEAFVIANYLEDGWIADTDFNAEYQYEHIRYYRASSTGENLNIHKKSGVSLIDYENNDLVELNIPAFPSDMKYYLYDVEVIGAGRNNGYETGDRLYYAMPTTDGTGFSYFHVIIQNANANNGNGKTLVYYSKTKEDSVTSLPLSDNTLIDTGPDGVPLEKSDEQTKGQNAKIIISSTPAINMYANLTGNSYTLSETQRLDEPIIEEYNHFTTYMEFKQPRIKHARVNLNVEYEENVNVAEIEINIRKALSDVFAITPYFLGQNISINKVWKAIQSVEGVKRFTVIYPTEDISCELNELLILNDSDIHINTILPASYR